MHLAVPFILLMGSFVGAALSIQQAQLSIEVKNIDTKDKFDVLRSSQELVMDHDRNYDRKTLRFKFTILAYSFYGAHGGQPGGQHLGFEDLNVHGFVRGELGFTTDFALRNGKLINGNRALGNHPSYIYPPWTTLWPLNLKEPHIFHDLVAVSKSAGNKQVYDLELANSGKLT